MHNCVNIFSQFHLDAPHCNRASSEMIPILAAPGSKSVPKCNRSLETWSGWVLVVPSFDPPSPRNVDRLWWRRLAIGSVRLWSCASIWVWPLSSAGRLDIDGELANCHRLLIRQPNVRFLWWGPEVGKGASVARLLIIPVYMFLIQKRQNNIYKLMRSFSSFWLFKMP